MGHPVAQARRRLAAFLFGLIATVLLVGFAGPGLLPYARAQDDKPEDKKDDKKADDKKSDTSTPSKSSDQNLFWHIVKSAGVVFGPLLLLISILLVWLVVLLSMDLRLGAAIPPGFVEDFTDIVNKRRFKEAYELAKEDNSFLGRVLTTGMSRLQYGIEDARESSANMVESIKASKEQLITYLATIGTLGPLLGLVGTVFAMILAFMKLKSGTVDAKGLADDISHGLVVTMLGIGLSVPAIFCHAFFRNRLIRLTMDTQNMADDLLTQMYHNSKKAGVGPAVAAMPSVEPVPAVVPVNTNANPAAIRPK